MKKRMKQILGVVALFFVYIWWAYPSFSWYQKMTVEVETPDGVVSGSSVVKSSVYYKVTLGMPEVAGTTRGWRGEATVVELPDGRYLFVLLGEPVSIAKGSFRSILLDAAEGKHSKWKKWYPKLEQLRESAPVPPKLYPLFVTFTDINDPTTVQQVDPDNLATTFGDGYSLKSVTLEITDEPVTRGRVEEILSCIKNATTCIPVNMNLPYGHEMRNIMNRHFKRGEK